MVFFVGAVAAGEGAGAGVGLLDWNQDFFAGVGETAAGGGDTAGEAAVESALVFFVGAVAAGEAVGAGVGLFDLNQDFFAGVGETAAGAGDTAGEAAVVGAFFLCLGLATLASGLAAGDGDWASNEVTENPIKVTRRPINLFMAGAYRLRHSFDKGYIGMELSCGVPGVDSSCQPWTN